MTTAHWILFIICAGVTGYLAGIMHERSGWNDLIKKGVIPKPKRSQQGPFLAGQEVIDIRYDRTGVITCSYPSYSTVTWDYTDTTEDVSNTRLVPAN